MKKIIFALMFLVSMTSALAIVGPSCTDTDNSPNPFTFAPDQYNTDTFVATYDDASFYTPGSVTITSIRNQQEFTFNDECIDNGGVNDGLLAEINCIEFTDGVFNDYVVYKDCANGCVNGACVPDNEVPEFGAIGAGAALIGAAAVYFAKKRK